MADSRGDGYPRPLDAPRSVCRDDITPECLTECEAGYVADTPVYRRGRPGHDDHNAPPITIGQLYTGKTLQLCATGDPVCFPGGLDRAAHSSYKDNGMADQAADFAARQLIAPAPAAAVQQTAGEVGASQPAAAPTSEVDPPLGN